MTKDQIRRQILEVGIVPVIRASSAQKAIAAAEAVLAGGVSVVEITMTVPRAKEAIAELSKIRELIVGAGTVLNAEKGARGLSSIGHVTLRPFNRNENNQPSSEWVTVSPWPVWSIDLSLSRPSRPFERRA